MVERIREGGREREEGREGQWSVAWHSKEGRGKEECERGKGEGETWRVADGWWRPMECCRGPWTGGGALPFIPLF